MSKINEEENMERKIFLVTLCSVLALVFMSIEANTEHETKNLIVEKTTYDADAKVNLNPAPVQENINDGRALGDILMTIDLTSIGMPGNGYANAGITWDGTHLYLVNMFNNILYVIDPTGPSLITSFSLPYNQTWGLGHEFNLWASEYASNMCYEIAGSGYLFFFYIGTSSPGDISEWWADGELWVLAVGGSNKIYKFEIPNGALLDSLGDPAWTYISQRGLSYDPYNNTFWLGGWNSNMVWEIDATTGAPLRSFSFNNIASLAYDWQSTLHPTPVLWLATNEAQNRIFMIDVDNPQPGVSEKPAKSTPLIFELSQNIPNPVKGGKTAISYITTRKGSVRLRIYDISGRLVKTLIESSNENAGRKTVYWDCSDDNHHSVSIGIYYYKLTVNERTLTKKMIIMK